MSDNLNKLEYIALLADSSQLAIELDTVSMENGKYDTWHVKCLAKMAWQRHWRRTTQYNKAHNENRYVPQWYIAEREQKNEH